MFGKNKPCYIVAEIGGNFTDYETACLLIDQAKECGADAVKLQTYQADTIVSRDALFKQTNTGITSQYEYFQKFQLSAKTHEMIYEYARKKQIDCFSTPSHSLDIVLLEKIGNKIYKIGADDATNLPFLKEIAKLKKPIILSTGMCTLEEIKEAVNTILCSGNSNLAILHTVGNYPTYANQVNLSVIQTLESEFPGFTIGYSDHTLGIKSCIFAAVMGAKVIEKHFTYDKAADGPDHMLSATKAELAELVESIRLFETMKGDGIKMPCGEEIEDRSLSRKSIIVSRNIKKGEMLTKKNLIIKRPGTGIAPKYLEQICQRAAGRDLEKDTILSWADIL